MVQLTVKKARAVDTFSDRARIPQRHRRGVKEGSICRLSCDGKSKLLEIRGKRDTKDAVIFLDAKTRKKLGVEPEVTADFILKEVGYWGQLRWAMFHADIAIRVAIHLGILSAVLGVISLGLAILAVGSNT